MKARVMKKKLFVLAAALTLVVSIVAVAHAGTRGFSGDFTQDGPDAGAIQFKAKTKNGHAVNVHSIEFTVPLACTEGNILQPVDFSGTLPVLNSRFKATGTNSISSVKVYGRFYNNSTKVKGYVKYSGNTTGGGTNCHSSPKNYVANH